MSAITGGRGVQSIVPMLLLILLRSLHNASSAIRMASNIQNVELHSKKWQYIMIPLAYTIKDKEMEEHQLYR